jgi:thiol-disulfide isomerase/thioredoxin
MDLIPKTARAPEIGQSWINSPPLSLRGLRGQVVLIDFWDYTCINCIRTFPYLLDWHRKYRGAGLEIIGVHTPEFTFSHTYEHIERAVREFGLPYPVVLDNDYQIWKSFSNRCWPAKYLIDPDGYIRYFHLGEGGYHEFEEALQTLLSDANPGMKMPAFTTYARPDDEPAALARCEMPSPELYFGHQRAKVAGGLKADDLAQYKFAPAPADPELAELDGWWIAHPECVEAQDTNGARVRFAYGAARVNVVLHGPGELEIKEDGKPLAPEIRGADVLTDEFGRTYVRCEEPRMYTLLESLRFRRGLLELRTSTPGLQIYAITFVTCVNPGL